MKRYGELDSIRGLASITVMLSHSVTMAALLAPSSYSGILTNLLMNTPFKILIDGQQAVVMFFILSGFVLSLPFLGKRGRPYSEFIIKRYCRIYIPYIIAVLFGLLMRLSFSNGGIYGLWDVPIDVNAILNHIFLITTFSQDAFDPVIWSLVHEMRISIIFPLLMIIIIKFDWKKSLLFGLICSLLGIFLNIIFPYLDPRTNYFNTLHYVLAFMSGAVAAKYKDVLINKYRSSSLMSRVIALMFGLGFYIYSGGVIRHLTSNQFIQKFIPDWGFIIGSVVIIIISLADPHFSKLLLKKPLIFLGRISYSLYLYHLVIFLTLASLLTGKVDRLLIWLIGIVLSLITASIAYFVIEKPSIKLGKNLVKHKRKNNKKVLLTDFNS